MKPVMKPLILSITAILLLSCAASPQRGIADKRSNFEKFIPMNGDVSRDGLKEVRPFFKTANRAEVLRAIERACSGGKSGSSAFNPAGDAGYYVNCNPQNRQLLNGYVPLNPHKEPHSR